MCPVSGLFHSAQCPLGPSFSCNYPDLLCYSMCVHAQTHIPSYLLLHTTVIRSHSCHLLICLNWIRLALCIDLFWRMCV